MRLRELSYAAHCGAQDGQHIQHVVGPTHELYGLSDIVVTKTHMVPVQQIDGLDEGCGIDVHKHIARVTDEVVPDFRHETVPNHREAVEVALRAGHDSKACAALAGREVPGPSQVPLGVSEKLLGVSTGVVKRICTGGLEAILPNELVAIPIDHRNDGGCWVVGTHLIDEGGQPFAQLLQALSPKHLRPPCTDARRARGIQTLRKVVLAKLALLARNHGQS